MPPVANYVHTSNTTPVIMARLGQVQSYKKLMVVCAEENTQVLDERRRAILEMPFQTFDGDERTLLRMADGIWIGINVSTIESVPFLKTFCSERWKSASEMPELSSVDPMTLKLVDFVMSSGRDLLTTPITRFHLKDKIAVSTLKWWK